MIFFHIPYVIKVVCNKSFFMVSYGTLDIILFQVFISDDFKQNQLHKTMTRQSQNVDKNGYSCILKNTKKL